MLHRTIVSTCLALALAWLPSAGAAAQPPQDDAPEAYYRAVNLGVDEMDHGNFEEALSRFLQAHEIYPNARTLRALGKAEYELRHYQSAIGYLERSLRSEVRPLTDALRSDVENLLAKARDYVATYTFVVEPESALLRLDGTQLELDGDAQVVLEVGRHVIEVEAPSHHGTRRELTVAGGRNKTIRLRLLPSPTLAPEAAPSPLEATRVDQPLRRKWWVWTGVGAVVLGAVATGVLLSMRTPNPEATGGTSDTRLLP